VNEKDRAREWASFYKKSALKYNMNALIAVYRNDGEKMLKMVLKELGLEASVDLVKDAEKNS
jgi:hypothetical protein